MQGCSISICSIQVGKSIYKTINTVYIFVFTAQIYVIILTFPLTVGIINALLAQQQASCNVSHLHSY